MDLRYRVMGEVMNFWSSRVILTAVELDIFTHLEAKPLSAPQLAEKLGTDARATDRLLDALCALELLEKKDDIFSLSLAGKYLSSRHPETILPMMDHFSGLWTQWSQLTRVVKEGGPAERSGFEWDEQGRKAFIGAMDAIGRDLSLAIADYFDANRFKCLLDIGGASGTYTVAFLQKNPHMKAVLFDLPQVVPMARERLRTEGLSERVTLVTGDFYNDKLPSGCDLALLSAIIHQNSPAQNLGLYRKILDALTPGGSLLIRDHIMAPSRTEPAAGTFFALNMLIGTKGGDTYTFAEIKDGLEKAGFAKVRLLKTGEQMDGLVQADKPA